VDYVWHTAHFRATDSWIGPSAGSDHLPVLAELVRVIDEGVKGEKGVSLRSGGEGETASRGVETADSR
jgi:hypothetical protein